jgi:peptide/nickel transport system permease protein
VSPPPFERPWQSTWRRFRRSRLAVAALLWVLLVSLLAILAPLLANDRPLAVKTAAGWRFPAFRELWSAPGMTPIEQGRWTIPAPLPYSPNSTDIARRLTPPDRRHRLGTDDLGRDVLARMIHGARVSLAVGLMATTISLIIGLLLGALAGFYGGWIDWLVSRIIETVLCFPFLFLVLAIVALFRPSLWTIMIALGLTSWTSPARYVRGELLRLRELEFAVAARAGGASDVRIILRHLLPNALAPVLVNCSFSLAVAILTESALSFLGFGVPFPTASWGSILSVAQEFITYAWWLALFPGLAIFTTVAAFNIIGDRFSDAFDPRSG